MRTDLQEQRAGFIASIIADPSDDGVRLIFADWLEENGEEDYGEFIRVQCELAKAGVCNYLGMKDGSGMCRPPYCLECRKIGGRRRRDKMLRREKEIFSTHADAAMQLDEALWGMFPEWHIAGWSPNQIHIVNLRSESHPERRLHFSRGFVEEITLSWQDWRTHHAALLATSPITTVAFSSWPELEYVAGVDFADVGSRSSYCVRLAGCAKSIWSDEAGDEIRHHGKLVRRLLDLEWGDRIKTWRLPSETR